MIWAGFSAHNRTDLVRIAGQLNEILRPVAMLFMHEHPNLRLFQQDNARPHTARTTQAYLQQEVIQTFPWPAFSPYMSPIEHTWDELGRRVHCRQHKPANMQQLMAALIDEWRNIPQLRIRRLVQSMRRRILAFIAASGGHTRY